MKSKPIILHQPIFTLFFLLLFTAQLSAQQNQVVHLTGAKMRAPLELRAGVTTVSLCDLTPGNTYTVIANGVEAGQQASFALVPLPATGSKAPQFTFFPGKKNAVRFAASSQCVDFQVKTDFSPSVLSVPVSLSVKCENCPEANAWQKNLLNQSGAAILQVQGGQTAEDLIKETLIAGDCFDVQNVTFNGNQGQIGTFSNGGTNVGFGTGVIMATGNISVAPGPNDADGASAGYGTITFDSDLDIISSGTTYDRASIEFDFTPTQTPVTFQFVFASEEYCEYVNSLYNDVFGFFISGPGITGTKNLAVVPTTTTPITINTVNHLMNNGYYVHNTGIFGNNCIFIPPSLSQAVFELQYDGFTKQLQAVADVIPCQTYHIKLKIADVNDGLWDSAVFLKAGSFDGGGDAAVDFVVNNVPNAAEASENCGTVDLVFDRVGSNLSQPVTVSFSVGGTATPGADYTPLDSAYTIPAGQARLSVPLHILRDSLNEGAETITLTLDNSCSCVSTQKTLTIMDYAAMSAASDTIPICSGSGTTLSANPQGGQPPYTFLWSTNATAPSITVNPAATTLYTVTITDECGESVVDTFVVVVSPLLELTENVTLCPGGSVSIGDSTYTEPTTVVVNLPGAGSACDTVITYVLTASPLNSLFDTIQFCPGGSVTIGDSTYTQPGTVTDTLPGMNGVCDTVVTYLLEWLPLNTLTDTIAFCPGASVTIGDSTYTAPTVVTDTLPGINGDCDTLATYVLVLKPQVSFTDTIAFCPGGSVTVGDSTYSEPAVVTNILPGTNGDCDTLATYVLVLKPQVSFTDTIAFCPGGSVTIGDSTYTVPATVAETLPGANGACDTLATHVLVLKPQISFTETRSFCPGGSVAIGDSVYTQPATVVRTLPGTNGACDTIATYVLVLKPQVALSETIDFCPGTSVFIGGKVYTQAGTVHDTLPGMNGQCDTLATYVLVLKPQVAFTQTITFCPGEPVVINGMTYTQAGTIKDTLPGANGACDTLATYVLQSLTPAPSTVKLSCPNDLTVTADPAVAVYNLPAGTTDCICPGLAISRTQGPASGSVFPPGATTVCYTAKDSCGNTASCCFKVTVPETKPCDSKTIGCIKYDLLDITKDAAGNKTYRIRVTDICSNRLIYTAFQLPNGVVAVQPPNNSIYTAPSGREYEVRNPNATPFHSIRFKSTTDSIASGESDIFEYTLPPFADPAYIHVISRVEPKIFYEAHLNTFNCVVKTGPKTPHAKEGTAGLRFSIFPNPTSGELSADLSEWAGERIQLAVFDSRGQRVQHLTLSADTAPQEIPLPEGLADGLYFLEIRSESGEKQAVRFLLQRR